MTIWLFLLMIFFDFSLTWTSIVRHMAEGDFIDSSDTVTEKERKVINETTDTLRRPESMWDSDFMHP